MSGAVRHAGLIAAWGPGWRGVLIEGPSGCGKSDLALRALGQGFRLVADDRVIVWRSGGRLFGRAPDTLFGLMEVRGLAVAPVAAVPFAEIALLVRHGAPERIPEPRTAEIEGVTLPLVELDLREISAPAKLSRALSLFDAGGKRRI